MNILICGSRTYYDSSKARIELRRFLKDHANDSFIHGGAVGIDSLADEVLRSFLSDYSKNVKVFRPQYSLYGKLAPIQRDRDMVDLADMVFALWNGESNGTEFVINYSRSSGKPVEIIDVKPLF